MEHMWKRFALFLTLACIAVVQPALITRAAGQHRVMIPVVATRPTPTPTPTPRPTATPMPTPAPVERYTAMERETVDRINAHRRAAGCANLVINDQLSASAERHSKDMAANNFMSHTGSDGSSAAQRVTQAGYRWRAVGENVAAGYRTAADVVQGWYDSEGHRKNMLNCAYQDIGIALEINPNTGWQYFWTTPFATK